MLATALTTSLLGLEANVVRVEVESSRGPSSFDLVGLAEASVRESRVRVRSALAGLGVLLDEHRIVVNLAPGDVRKTGSAFDLGIAVATLAALAMTDEGAHEGIVFLGELSLTGELRPVRGVLPQLLHARTLGMTRAIVPKDNAAEAAVVTGVETLVAGHLSDVLAALSGREPLLRATNDTASRRKVATVDLAEVRGQYAARRALEIAAAGHHHLLMMGPPGGGKTMLARRLPTILPPFTEDEALEASAVHSIAGLLPSSQGLLIERPFRAPHHTVSDAGLVGGGVPVRPGELSLAHHGVLFLDELPEFRRQTLETLRQPLEDGMLVVARARSTATFPARPLVIAACNPCPCGYSGDGTGRCGCTPDRVRTYLSRLSGPLVDRLDVHVVLPPVDVTSLGRGGGGEASEKVRERVIAAREVQRRRHSSSIVSSRTNAALSPGDLQSVALPDDAGQRLLAAATQRLGLSARAYTKVLRVARTIADLAGDEHVRAPHIAEAVQLRVFDRGPPRVSRPTPSEPVNPLPKAGTPMLFSDLSDKLRALKTVIAGIDKTFGKGAIMSLGDDADAPPVSVIATGSLALDEALGIGGYPRGRIVEIYGPESSGKTTLTLHAIAEVQRAGGTAAFIDAEHAFDRAYARDVGVDLETLLVSQPDTGEQALEIAEMLTRSGAVDLIVIDSVAALTPKAEIEGDMGDAHMGLQARLMSQALRKITAIAHKTETTIVFINQLRQKIGVVFGNPETTTGGNALKFYASVRLDVRRIGAVKVGEDTVGNRTRVKVVKNKLSPPFREAEFEIRWGTGIDAATDLLDVATARGLVEKSGAHFSFAGEHLGHGREKARDTLLTQGEVAGALRAATAASAPPRPGSGGMTVGDAE